MARIETYVLKDKVIDGDKWIGTDSSGQKTKNFGPETLADYMNEENAVTIAGQCTFKFQSDSTGGRQSGSISLDSFGGDNILMSSLGSFKLSENAYRTLRVAEYMLTLVGKKIIIVEAGNPNVFGIYLLTDMSESIYPGFYDVSLSLIQANGNITGGAFYSIAIYSETASIIPGTGDLTYLHNQPIASSEWTVVHNLQKYPSVNVILSSGQVGIADVIHDSTDQLRIIFASDESGKATIN
jgi:hypothetical protein